MMWGRRRRLPHCAAAPSSLYTLPSPSLLPTSSLSSVYLLPPLAVKVLVGIFGICCVYLPSILLQLIFGVSCRLSQTDRQTDGQTYGQLDGTETRQVLRLRLKFVGKLKTFSLTGAHNGKNNRSQKTEQGRPQSRRGRAQRLLQRQAAAEQQQ